MEVLILILIVIAGIALSGFFEGYETGIYCLNRTRLRLRLEQGSRAAKGVSALLANMPRLVGTTLIGSNIALYVASSALTALFLWSGSTLRHTELLATLVLAPLFFLFAQILPKDYSRKHADTLTYRLYGAIRFFYWLLYIPTVIVSGFGKALSALIGKRAPAKQFLDESEFLFYITEGLESGQLSPFQSLAARNVFALTTKSLKDIMVPLDRVASVPETATIAQVKAIVGEKRLSRLPVYRGEPANIIGKLHVLELPFRSADDQTVASYVHPVITVQENTPIDAALTRLQAARTHMALVTSREGAGAPATGIVTLKDIVEEIVGELRAW
jgi:CBS domain containing-hemolysin-like protein